MNFHILTLFPEMVIEGLNTSILKRAEVTEQREQAHQEVKAHHKGQARGFMRFAEGRLIKESERFRKRYFAIRDRKKRTQAAENEGINIPSDNPSKDLDPCNPSNPCSQIQPKADICDFRGFCVTDKPAAGDVSAVSALSAGQGKVLDCIKAHPGLKVPGIETETGIPAKSIERHIKVLIERRLIEHRGSKKTGGYHAL